MAAPSLISTRRFSASTRLRLQVLFARAWEALADTYQLQAAEFVRRLKHQLSIDEALDRFFREVGVPAADERHGARPGADRARADDRGSGRGAGGDDRARAGTRSAPTS